MLQMLRLECRRCERQLLGRSSFFRLTSNLKNSQARSDEKLDSVIRLQSKVFEAVRTTLRRQLVYYAMLGKQKLLLRRDVRSRDGFHPSPHRSSTLFLRHGQ